MTAGPDDTLSDLLAEVNDSLARPVVVALREPFVLTAHCSECGRMADVEAPAWQWAADSRCSECGGSHTRIGTVARSAIPEVFVDVDQTLPAEILALPCKSLGIGARDLLEARNGNRRAVVLQLGGTLEDLFQEIPSADRNRASRGHTR